MNISSEINTLRRPFAFALSNNEAEDQANCCQAIINACKNGRWDLIQTYSKTICKIKDAFHRTILMQMLHDPPSVSKLIQFKACAINDRDLDGNNALYLAISQRSPAIKVILEHLNSIDFRYLNKRQESAVHLAIMAGDDETLKVLKNAGDILEEILVREEYQFSPLLLAVSRGERDCVEVLLNAKSVEGEVDGIGNLLHVAAFFHQPEMLHYLLNHPKKGDFKILDCLNKRNGKGETPLCIAAQVGELDCIRYLHDKNADLNARDGFGNSPLHHAAISKNEPAIYLLAILKCDLTLSNDLGQSALNLLEADTPPHDLLLDLMNQKKNVRVSAFELLPFNFSLEGSPFVWVGILSIFEKEKLKIKRFTGNGPCALLATLIAVGYKANELSLLWENDPLLSFFCDECPNEAQAIIDWNKRLEELKKGNVLVAKGNSAIEIFRIWIEKLIKDKTEVDCLTFGELRERVKYKEGYKHLILYIENLDQQSILEFDSEFPKEEHENVIISDVLKIAVGTLKSNLSQTTYIKQKKDRVPYLPGNIHVKVLRESLIKVYDREKYKCPMKGDKALHNNQTIGLALNAKTHDLKRTIKVDYKFDSKNYKQAFEEGIFAGSHFINEKKKKLQFLTPSMAVKRKRNYITLDAPKNFIGRKKDLEIFENFVAFDSLNETSSVINLCGHPGIGKTELAQFYAMQIAEQIAFIKVIDCREESSYLRDYRELAFILELTLDENLEIDLQIVQYLESRPLNYSTNQPWLLIYENVTEKIRIPSKGGIVFILYHEKGKVQLEGLEHELFPFSEAESLQVLSLPSNSESLQLIKELGGIPILLGIASKYMTNQRCTPGEYLRKIRGIEHPLWQDVEGYHNKNLGSAYSVTLAEIKQKYPLAYEWLECMIYLGSGCITQAFMERATGKKRDGLEIYDPLARYLLLKHNEEQRNFSLHQLLQMVLCKKLEDEKRSKIVFEKLIDWIMRYSEEFDEKCPDSWWIGSEVVDHVMYIDKYYKDFWLNCSSIEEILTRIKLLNKVGSWLGQVQGHPNRARIFHERALELSQKLKLPTASSLYHIGLTHWKMGQYSEALIYLKKASCLNKSDIDQENVLNIMGDCLFNLDQPRSTLREYENAMEIIKNQPSISHPEMTGLSFKTDIGLQGIGKVDLFSLKKNSWTINSSSITENQKIIRREKVNQALKVQNAVRSIESIPDAYKNKDLKIEVEEGSSEEEDKFFELSVTKTGIWKMPSSGNQKKAGQEPDPKKDSGIARKGQEVVVSSIEDLDQSIKRCLLEGNKELNQAKRVLINKRRARGDFHEEVALCWINIAHEFHSTRHYMEAHKFYKKASFVCSKYFKNPDSQFLVAKCELLSGNCFYALNKHSEALEYYMQAALISFNAAQHELAEISKNKEKIPSSGYFIMIYEQLIKCLNNQQNAIRAPEIAKNYLVFCTEILGNNHPLAIRLSKIASKHIQNNDAKRGQSCILL